MTSGEGRRRGAGRGDDLRLVDWAFAQADVRLSLLGPDGRYLRLNQAACRALGLGSEALALGRRPADLAAALGQDLAQARSFGEAVRRVVRSGECTTWQGRGKVAGEGADRAWLVSISPFTDPAGAVRGALTAMLDVTDHDLARRRLALVNEASRRIGTTLDLGRTAAELAEVAVPALADLAVIDIQESVLDGGEPAAGPAAGTAPLRRLAVRSVLDGTPEIVAGQGRVTVYPPGSPPVRALASGSAVLFHPAERDFDQWTAVDSARGVSARRFGFRSFIAVPLRARGAVFGVALLIRHQRPEKFAEDDLTLAEEIVARAAVCIDNARRYARERETALTLQRSLIQRRLPDQGAVQVATRYRPAQAGVMAGGDWLDVIELSGSRVGLVAGDVAGHGIHAAATMGRMRTAVRTLADLDLEPAELLTRLDDVVSQMIDEDSADLELSATCLIAVYDPVTRRCSLARAGHLPPTVMTPGQPPAFVDLPAAPPLSVGGVPFEERELLLPEGSLLVMFTDGLVESRERPIDIGLNAVLTVTDEAASHREPSPDALCDQLISALAPGTAYDDVALLVARTNALPADQVASWDLPADPEIVAEARSRAVRQTTAWGLQEIAFSTELLVSELVTNAIRHARPPIQLRMILDTILSCEVSDASLTAPRARRADRYDEGGRGLMLVAQLAGRWGTRYTSAGKTIWAQQPLPRRPGPLRQIPAPHSAGPPQ